MLKYAAEAQLCEWESEMDDKTYMATHYPEADAAQESLLKVQTITHIGVELEKLTGRNVHQFFELFQGKNLESITFEELASILRKLAGLNNLGAAFRE
jgi:hypothetical protein